jgi:hypothetical protein
LTLAKPFVIVSCASFGRESGFLPIRDTVIAP